MSVAHGTYSRSLCRYDVKSNAVAIERKPALKRTRFELLILHEYKVLQVTWNCLNKTKKTNKQIQNQKQNNIAKYECNIVATFLFLKQLT